MNIKSEFENYSTKHLGISSLNLHDYQNSMTPYILEERELRATQMDIFSTQPEGIDPYLQTK